jgi:class 3 adenylate cyclase
MSRNVHDPLEAGREAMRRHAWDDARRLLAEADAEGKLDAEGLRVLAKALEWCGDTLGCIDVLERSYAAFITADNRRRAAMVALMIRHQHLNALGDAGAGRGWGQRAERLLEGEPECVEQGFLWRVQAIRCFLDGKPDEGRQLFDRAIELGIRLGNPNVVAMNLSSLGASLAEAGREEEGYAYLDEACAAAIGGELGPYATGIVYCNTISAYRNAGEFAIGSKWSDNATRWCRRESITGFSGICRVHRAEFMRLRGALADAEREATRASGELEQSIPMLAAEAHYEIGEVRFRLGDLAGADAAFRHAHELGREPQPGAALLLAAQGQGAAALRSLESSTLVAPLYAALDEMRCLAARVAIADEIGDAAHSDRAAKRAEELAEAHHGVGLRVLAVQARGTAQLALGEADAHKTLRRALRLWQEIDAPYEVAQVRLLLARALRLIGDAAGARREIEAALAGFERVGAAPDAERAKNMLDEPAASATVAQRTLLFSDIVGSTLLVEAIGDQAWTELVAWLDTSLRQCFSSHRGEEVDHAGDGFFVAFPDSRSALSCAITIQRKLADHRREHGFAPRIRIGVHATSASQAGGRYRGRGVHEASRIASLAGPDEIVASRDTVPAGFGVSEPREVVVKGISKPIEVVSVAWSQVHAG